MHLKKFISRKLSRDKSYVVVEELTAAFEFKVLVNVRVAPPISDNESMLVRWFGKGWLNDLPLKIHTLMLWIQSIKVESRTYVYGLWVKRLHMMMNDNFKLMITLKEFVSKYQISKFQNPWLSRITHVISLTEGLRKQVSGFSEKSNLSTS